VIVPADDEWTTYGPLFPAKTGQRAVIVVDVTRVSDSCGYSVPYYDFVGDRDLLDQWSENRGEAKLKEYHETRNAVSIDGIPAL
jgi:hypothetical protein